MMKNVSPWFLITGILIMFILMVASQIGVEVLFGKEAHMSSKAIFMKIVAHVVGALVVLFFVRREKTKTPILKRLGIVKPNISILDFFANCS